MNDVALIVALGRGGVIGRDKQLPWRLRADLQRFKRLTMGHPIVMGRKTFETIGRPLPGRENVIVTRNRDFVAAGCSVEYDLDAALDARADKTVFVIGGGQIYAAAVARATRIFVTQVDSDQPGDTVFPTLAWADWSLLDYSTHSADEHNEYDVTFMDFARF